MSEEADRNSPTPMQNSEGPAMEKRKETPIDSVGNRVVRSLEKTVRSADAMAIGTSNDYEYYETFPRFAEAMNDFGERVLQLIQPLLRTSASKVGGTGDSSTNAGTVPELQQKASDGLRSTDGVTDRLNDVIGVLDDLFEKVDTALDEEEGLVQDPRDSGITTSFSSFLPGSRGAEYRVFHSSIVARPQLNFDDRIDNSATPFVCRLKEKPNAIVPWEGVISPVQEESRGTVETRGSLNPYFHEIERLKSFPSTLGNPDKISACASLNETPVLWIDTECALEDLAKKLDECSEFAIDLEQHSYRSYQGFVCLMQISTREEDFLIDTLELRSSVQTLNSSFTNPKILKVLHGCDNDIVWLQRDFGIYVVNSFDTGQASRVLEYPSFSLAHLLKRHCGVDADKKYQLADWRIRPLPLEMLKYAREDTHYLLNIFDILRRELCTKGGDDHLIDVVVGRSAVICQQCYVKPVFDVNSLMSSIFSQHLKDFSIVQMRVVQRLLEWRDEIARKEDESPRYVMPNHLLLRIAQFAPRQPEHLLALFSERTPPLVRRDATDIVRVVSSAAKESPGSIPVPSKEQMQALHHHAADVGAGGGGEEKMNRADLFASFEWKSRDEAPQSDPLPSAGLTMQYQKEILAHQRKQEEVRGPPLVISTPEQTSRLFDSDSDSEDEGQDREAIAREVSEWFQKTQAKRAPPTLIAGDLLGCASPSPAVSPAHSSKHVFGSGFSTPPEIPSSVEQIYRLSNMNRKRNREKKMKQEKVRGGDSDEEGEEEGESKHRRGKKNMDRTRAIIKDLDEVEKFLDVIDWVPNEGDMDDGLGGPTVRSTTAAVERGKRTSGRPGRGRGSQGVRSHGRSQSLFDGNSDSLSQFQVGSSVATEDVQQKVPERRPHRRSRSQESVEYAHAADASYRIQGGSPTTFMGSSNKQQHQGSNVSTVDGREGERDRRKAPALSSRPRAGARHMAYRSDR